MTASRLPLPLFLAAVLCSSSIRAEDAANVQSEAYRTSVAQDTLRQDATAAQAELATLREEMCEFMPGEVTLLDRAFQSLELLSRNEMAKAVESLRSASKAGDLRAQLENLVDAQKQQTAISNGLQRMSLDLNAKQSLAKLAARIQVVLRDQSAAAAEVSRLVVENPDAAQLKGRSKNRYTAVATDQETVSSHTRELVEALFAAAKSQPEGAAREALVKANGLAAEKQLATSSAAAVEIVRQGRLDQAVPAQNGIVSTLAGMLDVLKAAGATPAERMKSLVEELRAIREAQQALAGSKDLEKKPGDLLAQEKALADRAAALAAELQTMNDRAADVLKEAQAQMEIAQRGMAGAKDEKPKIPEMVKGAADKLASAEAALQEQMAKLENPASTPQELANQLAQLKNATTQAALEQNRRTASAPEQSAAAADHVQRLQEQAAAVSPDAARNLGEAAREMKEADPASQQTAAQALAKASQELSQQLAALTGQTPAQQVMAKTEAQIQQASEAVAQAQSQVAQGPQKSADAVNSLADAVRQAAAAQQSGNLPQPAKDALNQAQQSLARAQQSAAQGQQPQAQAQATAAQQSLAQARSSLAQARQAAAAQAAPGMMAANAARQSQSTTSSGSNQFNTTLGDSSIKGPLAGSGAAGGPAQVTGGLTAKDRDAVIQLQTEKPPREFVSDVQQYYKNLADSAGD